MKLPAHYEDGMGLMDHTAIGQADADLTSATMAIDQLLRRNDLTATARRDFEVALRGAQRAARAVGRHVDYGAVLPAALPDETSTSDQAGDR